MRILFVSSEVAPLSKTGGLADVSSALPRALSALGHDVRVLTPRYGSIDAAQLGFASPGTNGGTTLRLRDHDFAVEFLTRPAREDEPSVHLLECGPLYDRPGIYVDPFANRDYLDNDYRYIALSKAAFELARVLEWEPEIVHCHDWQTALAAFYLHAGRDEGRLTRSRAVMTIHNMAYQGLFDADTLPRIGEESGRYFHPGGPLEFYGRVNFLKAGIEFSDAANTVSPTYAKEIQSAFEFGYGLETVLQQRADFTGILNGIDVEVWNPETDTQIAANYTASTLKDKALNKQALCEAMGLPYAESMPLTGMISRIVEQKGLDLLVAALPEILNAPAQFVMLGSGDPHYEHILREFARVYPERVAVKIGYDDRLSHLIEAGADMFLMPSQFEPCGLNQMMSMRYGTVPVVRATGGLADTVVDADAEAAGGTGFSFQQYTAQQLTHAVKRAWAAFRDRPRWQRIQRRGMERDFSWRRSAQLYVEMYERCLAQPPRIVE